MDLDNPTDKERAVLQRVAEHLRQFRNELTQDDYQNPTFHDGVLMGLEMAKNEVWRLAGSRPF